MSAEYEAVRLSRANRTHSDGADDTDNVITLAATPGKRHSVARVDFSYSDAPTGAILTVSIDGVTAWEQHITGAGVGPLDLGWLSGEPGEAVVITLSAGGSGITSKLTVTHD